MTDDLRNVSSDDIDDKPDEIPEGEDVGEDFNPRDEAPPATEDDPDAPITEDPT